MFYDNKVIIGICFGLPNVIGGCYFIFEFALWVWLKKKQVIVEDNTNDIISILGHINISTLIQIFLYNNITNNCTK